MIHVRLTVSLKEEFVEHNSEALANMARPRGSFLLYKIFQTLPTSFFFFFLVICV